MMAEELRLCGRVIKEGRAAGAALCSKQSIGFFGFVDTSTGKVTDPGHDLFGMSVAGKVLVFPRGKGSTVGSYALYELAYKGLAPAALVMADCETIIAVGAIIASIPAVDRVDVSLIRDNDQVEVDGDQVVVTRRSQGPAEPEPERRSCDA